jgi:hypothetical protein
VSPIRKLLLSVHITSATASLGASALGLVVLTGEPATAPVAGLAAANRLLTSCLVIQVLAVATGLLVAVCSRWGLLRYGWVVKKLCLTSAGLVVQVVLAVLGSRSGTRLWELEVGLTVVLLLSMLATVLSVYKPTQGLRRLAR